MMFIYTHVYVYNVASVDVSMLESCTKVYCVNFYTQTKKAFLQKFTTAKFLAFAKTQVKRYDEVFTRP